MPSVNPVKLFVAALFADEAWLDRGLAAVQEQLGPIDVRGAAVPFDHTDYYREEMGPQLSRLFVGLERLKAPDWIVEAKHAMREAEAGLSREGRRQVNLDAGYLDEFKVTLASFKGRGNKVYLGRDVWLDVQLYYERGRLHPLPWTFPDFRAGRYSADLLRLRTRYREQLRGRPFGAP
jgi:Domain of unknown function (DUF4416)